MTEQTSPERPGPPYYAGPLTPAPKRKRTGLVVALVAAALLLMAATSAVTVLVMRHDPPAASSNVADKATANCKQAMLDRLKSPGTAKFSDVKTGKSGNTFEVSGNLDAQNGFGGVVRVEWSCSVYDNYGRLNDPIVENWHQRE